MPIFNLDLNLFLIFLTLLLSFSVLLKETINWLYLWQKKEYRLDKMLDYISTPEGKKIAFNKIFKLRLLLLFGLAVYVFSFNFLSQVLTINFHFRLEFLLISLTLAFWLFEFLLWKKKLLAKKALLPTITLKSLVVFLASFSSFLALIIYLNLFFEIGILTLLVLNLAVFLIPALVGYWILLFFPVDYFIKSSIFKKARKHREKLTNLKVIAISGAYGKTTTKEILYQILNSKKQTEKTLKNQNSNMSCARKTLTLNSKTDYFLCELGAYKIGDGSEICQFVRPNMALISGLNLQHFALFKSKENILKAETEAIRFLSKGSFVFINYNSKMNRELIARQDEFYPEKLKNLKVIRYGVITEDLKEIEKDFEIAIKPLKIEEKETKFELILNSSHLLDKISENKSEKFELKTNLLGQGNLENLAGAIAVSLANGMQIAEIQKAVQNLPEFEITLKIKDKSWGKLLNDTYNANFDGIKNGIKLLTDLTKIKNQETSKEKEYQSVLFLDDIPELGKKSEETHLQLADFILQKKVDKVVLLGRSFKGLIQNKLLEKGFLAENILIWNEANQVQIADKINKIPKRIVLLAGWQGRKFVKVLLNDK